MRQILSFLVFLNISILYAQDTLSIKEIYFDNYLAYEDSTNDLFTGVAQKLRRNGNGHIVSEEIYENGVLLEWRSYFGKSDRRIAEKVFYYKEDPLAPKERIRYISNKKGFFIERTYYDSNFRKTLFTRHRDTTLIYQCAYKDGKKNGQEFCFDNKGNPIIIEFINGKKVKD